jgi:arginine deiminase
MVDGRTYWVRNAREERDLIEMLLAAARQEVEEAQAALAETQEAAPVPKRVRAKIRRMERRLEQAEEEVDTWMQYLRDRDEEIIMLLAH